jgi:hypothetical protein
MSVDDRGRQWLRPEPVPEEQWTLFENLVGITATVMVAGGIVVTLLAGLFVPTLGGRRSTRLKWESRRQDIREAIARDRHCEEPHCPSGDEAIQHPIASPPSFDGGARNDGEPSR